MLEGNSFAMMLALFLGTYLSTDTVAATDGNLCAVNNGNCSHECLYRGAGAAVQCACPCLYQLGVDLRTCEPIYPCDLDLLFIVDVSSMADSMACLLSTLGIGQSFAFFEEWRDAIVLILNEFEDMGNLQNVTNIGIQTHAESYKPQTVKNYYDDDGDLAAYVASGISSLTEPICGYYSNYVGSLRGQLAAGDYSGNAQYRGPGPRRDPTYTTFATVVFVADYVTINDNNLVTGMADVHESIDQLIVVSQKPSQANTFATPQKNDEMNRYVACGNKTASPCENYFKTNEANDGVLPSKDVIIDRIPLQACVARQSTPTDVVTSRLKLLIPKCILKGLSFTDFLFVDTACDLSLSVTQYDDLHYCVNIPPLLCGTSVQAWNTTSSELRNAIILRDYGASQNLPDVSFTYRSNFSRSYRTARYSYKRKLSTSSHQLMSAAIDFHRTSAFDHALAADSGVTIDDQVFLQASSPDLPTGFHLKFRRCAATSATGGDGVYTLLDNGCPEDDSFSHVTSAADARAKFNMFEFVASYEKAEADKDPISVSCTVAGCIDHDDPAPFCNVTCSGGARRRRSVWGGEEMERPIIANYVASRQLIMDNAIDLSRREEKNEGSDSSARAFAIFSMENQHNWLQLTLLGNSLFLFIFGMINYGLASVVKGKRARKVFRRVMQDCSQWSGV